MRLSAQPITTYNGINSFVLGNQWIIRNGDTNTLYFQIQDLDQDHLRYMTGQGGSATPVVVTVVFPSLDDDLVVTKTAIAVDAADPSLFKINMLATDMVSSGNVNFSVQEGANTRKFMVLQAVTVESTGSGDCC